MPYEYMQQIYIKRIHVKMGEECKHNYAHFSKSRLLKWLVFMIDQYVAWQCCTLSLKSESHLSKSKVWGQPLPFSPVHSLPSTLWQYLDSFSVSIYLVKAEKFWITWKTTLFFSFMKTVVLDEVNVG
jgi:hypothetical protein